ncbi:hypothetical protein GCM10011380_08980 [Sphingomonas metalli]|uniref:Uncharacterized protein n=1 Tax=Sphingomonas metalli TaxID=1779358 RepID=A0A916SX87_9SPHN|nr:hypothetical protein [Sphingomonas metalli]GGB21592.1 hypothetical protein GCM10011380_08980 [Sphingomonas metalli]
MVDPYANVFRGISDPGEHSELVTPSDTTDLPVTPKFFYVGYGGDVALIGDNAPAGAAPTIWPNVQNGGYVLKSARRICATGTTASGIVAIF